MSKTTNRLRTRPKEPVEVISDELPEYVLAPELADEMKRAANPPEDT